MKILLLGKKGLLGQEIVQRFKLSGKYNFLALGHEDLDITNKEAVYQILKDVKPNLIINAAAFTYVDECESKNQFAMAVNGEANGYIAEISNALGAYLMYFSTDYVFDGTKENGYNEDDTPSPINTYGQSKLLGEKLIQENTNKYYIIRTSWLFGMHGTNFVKTMLKKAQEGAEIKVVNDQIGKPTYTVDLAEALYNFIENANMQESGIYHLVNEGVTSWYDFAKNIFNITQINVKLIPIPSNEVKRQAKRPAISILHNNKLPKLRHHLNALKDYISTLNII
jgi:dTDP-4-dehydrorhamnose reductase